MVHHKKQHHMVTTATLLDDLLLKLALSNRMCLPLNKNTLNHLQFFLVEACGLAAQECLRLSRTSEFADKLCCGIQVRNCPHHHRIPLAKIRQLKPAYIGGCREFKHRSQMASHSSAITRMLAPLAPSGTHCKRLPFAEGHLM
jgi:hypothetical protein